ncbi:hypothetical protein NQD34_016013 [Periophthalmus magnuspinnatus]|nr:hypothetical protein NQD34_016013 [Periophthalmus magnuspinnatus]
MIFCKYCSATTLARWLPHWIHNLSSYYITLTGAPLLVPHSKTAQPLSLTADNISETVKVCMFYFNLRLSILHQLLRNYLFILSLVYPVVLGSARFRSSQANAYFKLSFLNLTLVCAVQMYLQYMHLQYVYLQYLCLSITVICTKTISCKNTFMITYI